MLQADIEAALEQQDQERHDNLQELMDRHKFHQVKLEQVMRALENDQVCLQLIGFLLT